MNGIGNAAVELGKDKVDKWHKNPKKKTKAEPKDHYFQNRFHGYKPPLYFNTHIRAI
ncbi:hypothetical protein BleG1_3474 [Shouchella lehensis G1]|uniref:Uncharacterized protein n=1 Tax=Shouchella lehensis G1 TaxID=1246626 RepID=A0A060LXN2_9BACI|nr:hypothetical protein BleG1_3474 [Shouchella lehensis G1]